MTIGQRAPDLISPDRLPHRALRTGELYLKRQMFKVENAAVLRLAALFALAFRELRAHGLDLADRYRVTKLDNGRLSAAWRDAFLANAQPYLHQVYAAAANDNARTLTTALTGAYHGRLWLLTVATKPDVYIHKPPVQGLDILTLLSDVALASTLVQALTGNHWRDQTQLEGDDLALQVRRALTQSMVGGESVTQALSRLSTRIDSSATRVQTQVRTQVNSASTAGALAAYNANRDVASGYEWLTAHDERVCPRCAALDGTLFTFYSRYRPLPPLHYNCRCTVVPQIKPDTLAEPNAMLRSSFVQWSQASSIEHALADFMNP